MKIIIFILFGLIGSVVLQAQDSLVVDTLEEATPVSQSMAVPAHITKAIADSAYIRNDFASAIHLYEALLKEKGGSADVYYNLGNSYYKADQIAKAVLNYERALLLRPGDGDIRFNLEMARSKTVDKVDPVSEMFFVTWTKALINYLGADAWARCGIVCFFLLLISLVAYIFSKQLVLKKVGFFSGIVFLVLTILSNIFAAEQKDELVNRHTAIVMAPSITVKSTPNESGTNLFVLHEGRKVEITDNSMKGWKEIRLEDGHVGWVPVEVIEEI